MPDNQTSGTDTNETKYGCNTCAISFDTREGQKAHMRESWHVYNLKRRIASLPSISATQYYERVLALGCSENRTAENLLPFGQSPEQDTQRQPCDTHSSSQDHGLKQDEYRNSSLRTSPTDNPDTSQLATDETQFSSLQCLFCNAEYASMESNLLHMSLSHSFFIPNPEYLYDMESLLSYFFIAISRFHECLYCQSVRNSKPAVQDHMRDKGHCRLDFEDDAHELEQFYDFPDEDVGVGGKPTMVPDDDDKLRLLSGKILGHRSRARNSRQPLSKFRLPSTSSPKPLPHDVKPETTPTMSNDREIAVRKVTSTSMAGVPDLQQRALMAVAKKIMKTEKREMNEYQSKVDKGGNKQKRYRVLNMGKKAGGLEKRLG